LLQSGQLYLEEQKWKDLESMAKKKVKASYTTIKLQEMHTFWCEKTKD